MKNEKSVLENFIKDIRDSNEEIEKISIFSEMVNQNPKAKQNFIKNHANTNNIVLSKYSNKKKFKYFEDDSKKKELEHIITKPVYSKKNKPSNKKENQVYFKKAVCNVDHRQYFILKFEDKVEIYKKNIASIKVDWRDGACTLNLTRDNLIKASMYQFQVLNPYKELKINFAGEVSHDAGGLIREWFTVLFKELQSEKLNLFERSENDEFSFKISSKVTPNNTTLDLFNFIGKIIAKALIDNITINACFNKLIYKLILNEQLVLDDLVFIDKLVRFDFKAN